MTVQNYLQLQQDLLKLEYEYEKEEYQQLCREVGVDRRIRQGKCWYPLHVGRCYYNALDQLCVEVEAPDEIATKQVRNDEGELANKDIDFEFEPGRPVAFFTLSNNSDRIEGVADGSRGVAEFIPYTCQVSKVDGMRMMITVPGQQQVDNLRNLALTRGLGVQLSFDATSHRVMREALSEVMNTSDKNLMHLRNVLIGDEKPQFRVENLPVSFPWLNPSQQKAVQKVLCAKEVAVVHGPPGTGKTTTLVEAISETLRREPQVMVCAQSNAAVDWICEQLIGRGISVLRVGNPMRVSDALLEATYERRYEKHPDYTELWAIRRDVRATIGRLAGKLSGSERASAHNHLSKLQNRAVELGIRIDEELFAHSRVIACTLIGSASRVLERKHYHTLFIDEAAQAMEAACWTAIRMCDRVILAGDHKQLPPTIKCREAEKRGLGKTLMERIAQRKPECVELLTVQYRMNRLIMDFPSRWFYHGRLVAAPEVADRVLVPIDPPLVWIDTARLGYEEEKNPISTSILNKNEAIILVEVLKMYVAEMGMERMLRERVDFGIISPYKSQVSLLRKMVRRSRDLKELLPSIAIDTVDGFQGRERDVVLISMVRGNDEGRIGFLNDLRRMNVAITRARMKLIIIGDTSVLSKTPFYNKLIEHVVEHGRMLEV